MDGHEPREHECAPSALQLLRPDRPKKLLTLALSGLRERGTLKPRGFADMYATSYPDSAPRTDPQAESSSLYDLFRVGTKMFERPTTRRTLRLAASSARAITGCAVIAAYLAAGDTVVRYSGRTNQRLDSQVRAQAGRNGVLEKANVWRYSLFFWGTGVLKGALVLESATEPSREQMFLLHALAEPTGAALATAELIEREHLQTIELRRLGDGQAASNQAMAATIAHLNAHQRISDAIVDAAGTGNGEGQIVDALSAIIRRSVVLQDSFGNQRAYARVGECAAPTGALVPDAVPPVVSQHDAGWRSALIHSRGETLGVIGIYDPSDGRTDDDRFAIEYATVMIALELAHRRNVAEVEVRLGRDLADDLVAGIEVADALDRAEAMRFDLSVSLRAVLIMWDSPTPNSVDVGAAVRHELTDLHIPALISRRPDATLVVIADGHDLSALHGRLSTVLSSARGTIGVGEPCAAEDLARSLAEASRALHFRLESHQPYGLSNHDELGLLRILDTSDRGAELDTFVKKWIGALLDHDRDHGSELVRTLGVYLDSGGNYDRASGALIIHRSTLRYRLRRIRELSGLDLGDPDSRLNLHVALRVWAVLRDDSP
jgi:sugar diacid utilization regulator